MPSEPVLSRDIEVDGVRPVLRFPGSPILVADQVNRVWHSPAPARRRCSPADTRDPRQARLSSIPVMLPTAADCRVAEDA